MLKTNRTQEEREQISACVATLCEAVGRKPSKPMYLAYEIGTLGIPVEQIERATTAALQRPDKWMPSPGELRELAGDVRPADRAAMAFQALKTACSRVGAFRSPDFDDALINATVRNLGGWTRACEMPVSEFDTWYRKDFIEVYQMFCRTGTNPEQDAPLIGESEASNLANGFLEEVPGCRVPVVTGLPWAGTERRRLAGSGSPLVLEGPR